MQTAFNRFNDLQFQVGGSAGKHVYFRLQVSNGNPTFFRDSNVLAGDNGVEPPPNPDITFDPGFPIFYHAEVEEVAFDDNPEGGFGAGFRWTSDDQRRGLDLFGFYYQTTLSESAKLNGTFYEGDLDILNGAGVSLPISGDERREWGFNADGQYGNLGLFLQYVDEEAASLPRTGIEVEAGYEWVAHEPLGLKEGTRPEAIEVLRHQMSDAEKNLVQTFPVLSDAALSRCLNAIHREPHREWTLQELASLSAISRSGLMERFQTALDTSPMKYLRDWRLYLASVRLKNTADSITRIAIDANYGSEAAFNRAFTRAYGVSPGAWRQKGEA